MKSLADSVEAQGAAKDPGSDGFTGSLRLRMRVPLITIRAPEGREDL